MLSVKDIATVLSAKDGGLGCRKSKAWYRKVPKEITLLLLLQRNPCWWTKLSGTSFGQNTRVFISVHVWRLTSLLGKPIWACHQLPHYVYLLMKWGLYYLSEQSYCAIMDDRWTLSKSWFWSMALDRRHWDSYLRTFKHWIWDKEV